MQASYAVFLVAVLSITRSIVLVRPFYMLSKRAVLNIVLGYAVYLVLNQIIPLATGHMKFIYTSGEVYCWDESSSHMVNILDTVVDLVSIVLPIIPITCSCIISCVIYATYASKQDFYASNNELSNGHIQKATGTIILVTIVYIVFNIPLFINYVFWTIIEISDNYSYPDPFYKSNFMYFYSWNITDIFLINLNSLANPFIYFYRIRKYRLWLLNKIRYYLLQSN